MARNTKTTTIQKEEKTMPKTTTQTATTKEEKAKAQAEARAKKLAEKAEEKAKAQAARVEERSNRIDEAEQVAKTFCEAHAACNYVEFLGKPGTWQVRQERHVLGRVIRNKVGFTVVVLKARHKIATSEEALAILTNQLETLELVLGKREAKAEAKAAAKKVKEEAKKAAAEKKAE